MSHTAVRKRLGATAWRHAHRARVTPLVDLQVLDGALTIGGR